MNVLSSYHQYDYSYGYGYTNSCVSVKVEILKASKTIGCGTDIVDINMNYDQEQTCRHIKFKDAVYIKAYSWYSAAFQIVSVSN